MIVVITAFFLVLLIVNSSIVMATTKHTAKTSTITDNFYRAYSLKGGQTSPNGFWYCVWTGYGNTGVKKGVYFLQPMTVTRQTDTSSSLVTTTENFADQVINLDVKTVSQLRQNSPPNDWEVAWVFFRYTSTSSFYWFIVKTNGFEFGKKQGSTTQIFLVTGLTPSLTLNTWSHWQISVVGNHIQISVGGNKIIDYTDQTMSSQLSSGKVAMYCEDSLVNFDNISVK